MAKQNARQAAAPDEPKKSAEYTVVARRYRPQQFADLVGQETVARALTNAIQNDRVAHAYLFTGVRGTGKTSTARILAKALNCAKGPTPTPCDQCEICLSIANGEDIDVLEIDGASNRGIDEIRSIRQNVGTRPSRSRYKIYIIDEVHMVTAPAFNALLKTLEEPPKHVKFIFATTDVQKIPITILSRCQRFDFAGITSAKIAQRLKQVVAAEGMEADETALMAVARRAGGSMRDAQSLLDQLMAFDGSKLSVEKVHQLLGAASDERLLRLVNAIVAKDPKTAFELIGRFIEEGLQIGEIFEQLIEYWRCLMVLNCAGKDFADVSLSEASREKAVRHAESLSLDSILAGLDVLTNAKNRLRGSNHGAVLLEMAVLRLIRLDELVPISQLVQLLNQPGTTAPTTARPNPGSAALTSEAAKKKPLTRPDDQSVQKAAAVERSLNTVEEIWAGVCESVGPILAANLVAAGPPAILGPNSLVLYFDSRYTSQYDYCSLPTTVAELEKRIKALTGRDWQVRTEKKATSSNDNSPTMPEPTARQGVTYRERNDEVMRIPLLNWASEKLGARLLKHDTGFGLPAVAPTELDNIEPQEP